MWGVDDPLASLGLAAPPDLVLASDVVYGNDPKKWRQLVKTMCDLSGANTLVIIGNVQRYPVHHPMAETKFFTEATAADFDRREVPVGALHPDFRRTGGGSCVVHVFRRKPESLKKRGREERRDEKKEEDVSGAKKKAKKEAKKDVKKARRKKTDT